MKSENSFSLQVESQFLSLVLISTFQREKIVIPERKFFLSHGRKLGDSLYLLHISNPESEKLCYCES